MTLRGGIAVLVTTGLLAAAAAAGSAPAATVLVVTGRGWGHGVGMSQWGAYGYALHGWNYKQILAHYYPGTELGQGGDPHVRVLLAEGQDVVTVGCQAPMTVTDGNGVTHQLREGTYGVGPRLVLPVGQPRVVPHRHGPRVLPRPMGVALRPPVAVACATAPLALDGRGYHGLLDLLADGGKLSVVNSLPLDVYVRDVVGAEMPSHWSFAALQAQAVAARSYALATLRPDQPFDLYPDQRSQAYGGIAAEDPHTNLAVASTAGQVLTWDGRVATTYYSSSSGGRTADIRDLWPQMGAVPYLRSVPDPYDDASPHHEWGPVVVTSERLAARLGVDGDVAAVRLERSPSGRVAALDVRLASGATERLTGRHVASLLRLRSTWFDVGELTLSASAPRILYGSGVRLDARVTAKGAVLQRRLGDGPWLTVRAVGNAADLTVWPQGTTSYRLTAPGVAGPELDVAVAPRVSVQPLTRDLLGGKILPRPTGPVTVWRWAAGGWQLVAHPLVGDDGTFRTPLLLRAGGYRISVGGDGTLAPAQASLTVTKRLLASLGQH